MPQVSRDGSGDRQRNYHGNRSHRHGKLTRGQQDSQRDKPADDEGEHRSQTSVPRVGQLLRIDAPAQGGRGRSEDPVPSTARRPDDQIAVNALGLDQSGELFETVFGVPGQLD
jgi:hypothetical protein